MPTAVQKYLTTLANRHERRAIERAIRQTDPSVVPGARTCHEQRIDGVHSQCPDRLQDVGNSWRARTGIAVVVGHVRKQAGDAGAFFLLDKYVAMVALTADGG